MAFPDDRPVAYDPDAVFDESANDWTTDLSDLDTSGGEKYKQTLIVMSDQGIIYFGALT